MSEGGLECDPDGGGPVIGGRGVAELQLEEEAVSEVAAEPTAAAEGLAGEEESAVAAAPSIAVEED